MTDRAAYIAGLRELADRLDANPDCPLPYTGSNEFAPLEWILDSREDVSKVARLLGNVTKGRDAGGSLTLTASLHGLGIRVLTYGDVCERVEVGTTTETREEVVTPAVTRTVEVEVPKYETRCPESILAPVESYAEVRARTLAEDRGVTA